MESRGVFINKAGEPPSKHLSKWEIKKSLRPLRTLADGHAACLIRGGVIKCILVTGCWLNWLWQLIDTSGSPYITLQSHNPPSKESKLCRSIKPRWTGWPALNGVYPRCRSPRVRINSPSPSPCVAISLTASRKPPKGTHHLHVRQLLEPIKSLWTAGTAQILSRPPDQTAAREELNFLKHKSTALTYCSCYWRLLGSLQHPLCFVV